MSVGKKRRTGTVRSQSTKVISQGICPLETCGKVRFLSRKDAKIAAKRLFPGDHLNAYECDGWWHFGHKPERVIRGEGWGGETRLIRQAARLHQEDESNATSCEGCGVEVLWTPGQGYVHDCEVVGVEDETKEVT